MTQNNKFLAEALKLGFPQLLNSGIERFNGRQPRIIRKEGSWVRCVAAFRRNFGVWKEQNALRLEVMGGHIETLLAKTINPNGVCLRFYGPVLKLIEYPSGYHSSAVKLHQPLDIDEAPLPLGPGAGLARHGYNLPQIDRCSKLLKNRSPLFDNTETHRSFEKLCIFRCHFIANVLAQPTPYRGRAMMNGLMVVVRVKLDCSAGRGLVCCALLCFGCLENNELYALARASILDQFELMSIVAGK